MALVKVKVTCPHCKVDHEEYDETKYNEREKYLAYWNLPFEGKESDIAWHQKLAMITREAPTVIADIAPYQSMADGTMVEGRKQHREMLKRNNCVEIGSEKQSNQEPKVQTSSRSREQLARLVYEKLRY